MTEPELMKAGRSLKVSSATVVSSWREGDELTLVGPFSGADVSERRADKRNTDSHGRDIHGDGESLDDSPAKRARRGKGQGQLLAASVRGECRSSSHGDSVDFSPLL